MEQCYSCSEQLSPVGSVQLCSYLSQNPLTQEMCQFPAERASKKSIYNSIVWWLVLLNRQNMFSASHENQFKKKLKFDIFPLILFPDRTSNSAKWGFLFAFSSPQFKIHENVSRNTSPSSIGATFPVVPVGITNSSESALKSVQRQSTMLKSDKFWCAASCTESKTQW